MGAKGEQVKGHAKEAAGSLLGDEHLESEGKADRHAGEAKEKLGEARDKVEGLVESVKDKAEELIDKAKDARHRK